MDADAISFDGARAGSADPAEISGRRSPWRARRLRLPRLLTWGSPMLDRATILFRYVPPCSLSLLSSHLTHIHAHGRVPVLSPADRQLQLTLVAGKQLRQWLAHRVRGPATKDSGLRQFQRLSSALVSPSMHVGTIWTVRASETVTTHLQN